MKNNLKVILRKFFAICIISILPISVANAQRAGQSDSQYPYVSANILSELKYDYILSKKNTKASAPVNNGYINIEPDISLHFNKNWSVTTAFRVLPIKKRSQMDPLRARTFFDSGRGFNIDDTGIIVEELRANFENDDLKLAFGKFNPTFGTAYRKKERIGVFVTDFTEDYELKEKIGGAIAALFDNSQLTFNVFFNDTTDLSNSAINKRGKERRSHGLAGNKKGFSSYSVTFEGKNIFSLENLSYNLGIRSQEVDGGFDRDRETGFTANAKYSFQLQNNVTIVPFVEVARFDNFTGDSNTDAIYLTTAVVAEYRNWDFSLANVVRRFDYTNAKDQNDNLLQASVGYKITKDIKVDVSRAEIKEDGARGSVVGAMLSYVKEF